MATDRPETPHGRTSAPVKAPGTRKDEPPAREPERQPVPTRQAGDEEARGDRMPRGADEPGAGL